MSDYYSLLFIFLCVPPVLNYYRGTSDIPTLRHCSLFLCLLRILPVNMVKNSDNPAVHLVEVRVYEAGK